MRKYRFFVFRDMSQNGNGVKELNTEIILPSSYYLRQGRKQANPLTDLSFQRRAETANTSGVYSWWFARYDDGSEISPYWSEQRDRDLREFWLREGNDILQGAVSSMVKWGSTLPWVVEGPDRVVRRYQSVLSESEFGQGWQSLIPKVLTDYYTQDKGATIEVIGAGNPDGPIEGPVVGLAHLDAQFVQPTGDADYPILYLNTKDGKPHRIHYSRCIRIVDMPSPNELLCGVGFCAVSRVIASSQILLKLARYKNEKLSDMPEAGLLILNNLMPKQWADAKAQHQRERRKLGQEIWSNIMTLFSIDPAQPATATLTSFANLPEGFDELVSTNLYVNIVALAFGVDPREFWPVSGGPLGTARESETMANKAKGKGKGDIISNIERAINWRVLPESVSFRFDAQDDEEDKLKAEINDLKTKSILSMWKPESIGQGAELPVTALEIRQMLADNVPDYFKKEFLEVQISDEEELTDTEREDKGARVSIGHKGQILSTQRTRVSEVLKLAEENYKAGRISLDQLIEFRLGELYETSSLKMQI